VSATAANATDGRRRPTTADDKKIRWYRARVSPTGRRFIVYGAGAIGGTIGGRLFQHGHDVILIARGRHFEAIMDGGLVLRTPDETANLPIPVVDDPAGVAFGREDVVILAMKTQDTEAALARLVAAASSGMPVVCAQNGVENERLALRRFANVYGMYVVVPATHLHPGIVETNSTPITGVLDLGRYPSGAGQVAEEVAAALGGSTFSSRVDPAIMRWKYAKLLANLGNALEAACGPGVDDRDLRSRVRAEGRACLAAAGITVAPREEERARTGDLLNMQPIDGQAREGGSSWQSLTRQAGTVEADWLNGEIVLLGRLHGVETPLNQLLQRTVNRMAREHLPPGSMTVEELLAPLG
jgi:2-dehydropantoate 2-reductase